MNSNIKTLIFWVVLICVAVLLFAVVRSGQGHKETELSFTQFLDKVQAGEVKNIVISGNDAHGEFTNGTGLHTIIPLNYPDMITTAEREGGRYQLQRFQLR